MVGATRIGARVQFGRGVSSRSAPPTERAPVQVPGVSVVPLQLEAVQNPPAMTWVHVEPVARPVAPDVHVPASVAKVTNSAAVVQYCVHAQHQDRTEGVQRI